MSTAKLTLRLDETVVAQGKELARREGTSLSKLIESYLRDKTLASYKPVIRFPVDLKVEALPYKGGLPVSLDDKALYEEYLRDIDVP